MELFDKQINEMFKDANFDSSLLTENIDFERFSMN